MRSIKIIFPFLLLAASCGNSGDKKKQPGVDSSVQTAIRAASEKVFPQTFYVGDFVSALINPKKDYTFINKITVSIDSLGTGNVKGYSVVAGNKRPFSGSFKENSTGKYECNVKEPGDDKYDGVFTFTLMPDSGLIRGSWQANDQGIAVPKRTFVLYKKEFKYDANLELGKALIEQGLYSKDSQSGDPDLEKITAEATKYNASAVELKKENVENMYKGDMEILRNSIYARHGYSFKNKRMRFIFDKFVDWYMPISTDVRTELTKLEQKNIALLQRYEEHADKYYDDYGR